MYKFFVNEEQIEKERIYIKGQDVNHIRNVLRLNVREKLLISNKDNLQTFKCIIEKIENDKIFCKKIEAISATNEANTDIHIFQGMPKSDKMELIIEKCTEIGVKEITPVVMKRTIVKMEEKDKKKRIERWRKIAEVASKQSKRDKILCINDIINFENIFKNLINYDIVLVAYENEKENLLKKVLKNLKNKQNKYKIAVIIGPEGGIDEEEINILDTINTVVKVTLGNRILRTETAPIVISANILYELEE